MTKASTSDTSYNIIATGAVVFGDAMPTFGFEVVHSVVFLSYEQCPYFDHFYVT